MMPTGKGWERTSTEFQWLQYYLTSAFYPLLQNSRTLFLKNFSVFVFLYLYRKITFAQITDLSHATFI